MVWVPPPEKVSDDVPTENVTPDPFVQLPYTDTGELVLNVMAVVLADMSTVGRNPTVVPTDMVPVTVLALLNVAVSWGNGK